MKEWVSLTSAIIFCELLKFKGMLGRKTSVQIFNLRQIIEKPEDFQVEYEQAYDTPRRTELFKISRFLNL